MIISNITTSPNKMHSNSTTNNMILDHLFYQSIQSRLQKIHTTNDNTDDDKDKNVIESVIENFLSNKHRKNDPIFEQRLNLCQLTNLTLSRTHHVTFAAPVYHKRNQESDSILNQPSEHSLFSKPFEPTYCRSHRRPHCSHYRCAQTTGPGLVQAIPAFLKSSAHMLRSVLENCDDDKPLTVAGQQVMGGGMPPRWYDLFLDLLSQAAIQTYMCDGQTGVEAIYEIFSYGYVEDEEEEEQEDEEEEEEEEEEEDIWNVKAEDHHLLFPKTRTMYLFKLQVHEREKEFIHIKPGDTLESHFMALERLYPLESFERNMSDFIQMLLENMDIPSLDKCDTIPDPNSPIKSPEDLPDSQFASMPSLYIYPGDGSILMPEIPDFNINQDTHPISNDSITILTIPYQHESDYNSFMPKKRSANKAGLDNNPCAHQKKHIHY